MSGINVGPFPIRPAATWYYAAPVAGVAVLESATLVPAAGPGRRRMLTAVQFSMIGESPATMVIKTGATVLLRIPILFGFPVSMSLTQPLQSEENEALTLEIEGQEGMGSTAVFVNAQGYTA
jgi:hypothetical protein